MPQLRLSAAGTQGRVLVETAGYGNIIVGIEVVNRNNYFLHAVTLSSTYVMTFYFFSLYPRCAFMIVCYCVGIFIFASIVGKYFMYYRTTMECSRKFKGLLQLHILEVAVRKHKNDTSNSLELSFMHSPEV